MDLTEAYRILGIQDRSADIQDPEILQLQREVAVMDGKEAREKIDEAYELVFKEKFEGRADSQPRAQKGSEEWPVGLENIGNTCYLNSALQFFFAIRPFREWVLNFKETPVDQSDLDLVRQIREKRVGGRLVTLEEVNEGQERKSGHKCL